MLVPDVRNRHHCFWLFHFTLLPRKRAGKTSTFFSPTRGRPLLYCPACPAGKVHNRVVEVDEYPEKDGQTYIPTRLCGAAVVSLVVDAGFSGWYGYDFTTWLFIRLTRRSRPPLAPGMQPPP